MEASDHWPVSHRLFSHNTPCCEKQRPEIEQGNKTCRHRSNTKVNPQQQSIECLLHVRFQTRGATNSSQTRRLKWPTQQKDARAVCFVYREDWSKGRVVLVGVVNKLCCCAGKGRSSRFWFVGDDLIKMNGKWTCVWLTAEMLLTSVAQHRVVQQSKGLKEETTNDFKLFSLRSLFSFRPFLKREYVSLHIVCRVVPKTLCSKVNLVSLLKGS